MTLFDSVRPHGRGVGLDISLKGLGIVVAHGDPRKKLGDGLAAEATCIRAGQDVQGPERLAIVTNAALSWLRSRGMLMPGQIFVSEGYAFGSQQAHSLGEIGGCIRRELWLIGANLIVIPPPTLKKFTCGVGAGAKNVIMKAVWKRWGFDSDDDNECDAFGAAVLAVIAQYLAQEQWTKIESEILLKKVERYAGKNQEAWLGGAPAGKVARRSKRRRVAGRGRDGSSVLGEDATRA